MGHGPRDGLPFWNQLGLLPVEQSCASAQQEQNEVDSHLVDQAYAEHLPGDIHAQHPDVLAIRGLLGAPDRGLQAVEGERPAVVAAQVLQRPVGDHEAGNTRPWRAAPLAHAEVERAPSDDRGANVRVPFSAQSVSIWLSGRSPNIHACRCSPPSPIGSSSRMFGPAADPSSDTE